MTDRIENITQYSNLESSKESDIYSMEMVLCSSRKISNFANVRCLIQFSNLRSGVFLKSEGGEREKNNALFPMARDTKG